MEQGADDEADGHGSDHRRCGPVRPLPIEPSSDRSSREGDGGLRGTDCGEVAVGEQCLAVHLSGDALLADRQYDQRDERHRGQDHTGGRTTGTVGAVEPNESGDELGSSDDEETAEHDAVRGAFEMIGQFVVAKAVAEVVHESQIGRAHV